MTNHECVGLRDDGGPVNYETTTVVQDMIAMNIGRPRNSGNNVILGYIQNYVSENTTIYILHISREVFLQNVKQPFVVIAQNAIFENGRPITEEQQAAFWQKHCKFPYTEFKEKR